MMVAVCAWRLRCASDVITANALRAKLSTAVCQQNAPTRSTYI